MTNQSIKVEELREALRIVKGVQSSSREIGSSLKSIFNDIVSELTFDDLMELKDNVYLFKTGELVSCNWGGQNKIGFIVDPIVRYNGYMKFSKKHSEKAAIVRFFSKSSTGYKYSNHEVVPYRSIAKVVEIQKGIVKNVISSYELTVDFIEGSHKGISNRKLYCNDVHGYAPGVEVEILHTKELLVRESNSNLKDLWSADRFYIYQPWQSDEKDKTKLNGYEL
ncbi:hypothetical protein [Metabacillus arenae]|uniref:Uncharacterized protein n=1 Tax=Metabacillus arenae TaxID=2771434 RepID=A0A926RV24_9BACI|nr:hypothetical protein [Metabacillus arenae]MBD1379218.1 hypothetical protein [Metabacillus arenae]